MEEQRIPMGQCGGALAVHMDGPRVTLEVERPDDKRGLYKAYLRGKPGRMLLGTLMPEEGRLRLRRTYSQDELMRKGFWPIEGAEAELAYGFAEKASARAAPPGWSREKEPCRLLGEPILRHAAREIPWGLVRRERWGFLLALPFRPDRQFPIPPIFCFAGIEQIGEGRYAIYRFDEKGWPVFKAGE